MGNQYGGCSGSAGAVPVILRSIPFWIVLTGRVDDL